MLMSAFFCEVWAVLLFIDMAVAYTKKEHTHCGYALLL